MAVVRVLFRIDRQLSVFVEVTVERTAHVFGVMPQNAVTNRPYSGCNVILLWLARSRGSATPRFLTIKQAAPR
jgi:hypothetical protein